MKIDDPTMKALLAKKARHRPFDFDQYYPRIKNHTWSSFIVPFSQNLAQASVNYYQVL